MLLCRGAFATRLPPMQNVVLVCGLPATGKTTSSLLLYRKCKRASYIDGDALTNVQEFLPDDLVSRLKVSNAACVIGNFLTAGCDPVICDGVIDSQEELDRLKKVLQSCRCRFLVFALAAERQVRNARWMRNVDPEDPPRSLEQVDMQLQRDGAEALFRQELYQLDTTKKAPEDVAHQMLEVLRSFGRSGRSRSQAGRPRAEADTLRSPHFAEKKGSHAAFESQDLNNA